MTFQRDAAWKATTKNCEKQDVDFVAESGFEYAELCKQLYGAKWKTYNFVLGTYDSDAGFNEDVYDADSGYDTDSDAERREVELRSLWGDKEYEKWVDHIAGCDE